MPMMDLSAGPKEKIIKIHHECPCMISPEGVISLYYVDRLMMDCFSTTFLSFFVET